MSPASVGLNYIEAQRASGWPDIHPEDYCHRCGNRNPLWCADAEDWATATAEWAATEPNWGICCPTCFADMHAAATGKRSIWMLEAFGGGS